MADFISNLYIKSFRGISDLELRNLSGVNILTGDNNSGKTSVLEVLMSMTLPDNTGIWGSLLRKESVRHAFRGMSYYEGILDLFNAEKEIKQVEFEAEFKEEFVHFQMNGYEVEEEMTEETYEKNIQMISRIGRKDELSDDIFVTVPKIKLRAEINGAEAWSGDVYEGGNLRGLAADKSEKNQRNILYISPTRHTEGNFYLTEVLNNPELYEEMLEVLREYDQDIISINYVKNDRGMGGMYKVLSRSYHKALPLNVYGDGMKKAVLLMSAVVKAKNGILLLDEFETAIHTSAMEKTFKWILETCQKLHVQLFLTSHSREAINKILKCAPDIQNDMTVYTLYRNGKSTSARRLPARKAIEVQDDMGLELR